jgi:hypothetical protein
MMVFCVTAVSGGHLPSPASVSKASQLMQTNNEHLVVMHVLECRKRSSRRTALCSVLKRKICRRKLPSARLVQDSIYSDAPLVKTARGHFFGAGDRSRKLQPVPYAAVQFQPTHGTKHTGQRGMQP